MKILGFISESFQDWEDGLASVIFTGNCNFKCPACYSKKLLEDNKAYDQGRIVERILERKRYVKRAVICGGEPTLQPDLLEFTKLLKGEGIAVKLDTNGSNPDILERLLSEKAVNYVAMDIKGPPNLYPLITGLTASTVEKIEQSMNIVAGFPGYEFRTTVSPVIREGRIDFLSVDEMAETAEWILKVTGRNSHKYFIQQFVAKSKDEMLDGRLSRECLPKEMHETPSELMGEIYNEIIHYLPNCRMR